MGDVVPFHKQARPGRKPAAPQPPNEPLLEVWTCACGGHEFLILKEGGFVCLACGGRIGNMDWQWRGDQDEPV